MTDSASGGEIRKMVEIGVESGREQGRVAGLREAAALIRNLKTADPDCRNAWKFAADKIDALAADAGREGGAG